MKPRNTRLSAAEIFDVVLDQVAEEEAENRESTEADERWAEDLHRKLHARLAEMRRQLGGATPPARTPASARR